MKPLIVPQNNIKPELRGNGVGFVYACKPGVCGWGFDRGDAHGLGTYGEDPSVLAKFTSSNPQDRSYIARILASADRDTRERGGRGLAMVLLGIKPDAVRALDRDNFTFGCDGQRFEKIFTPEALARMKEAQTARVMLYARDLAQLNTQTQA